MLKSGSIVAVLIAFMVGMIAGIAVGLSGRRDEVDPNRQIAITAARCLVTNHLARPDKIPTFNSPVDVSFEGGVWLVTGTVTFYSRVDKMKTMNYSAVIVIDSDPSKGPYFKYLGMGSVGDDSFPYQMIENMGLYLDAYHKF